jgi:orotidine-5'-phosphate decarboxylase
MESEMSNSRIIVSLDFAELEEALALADRLDPERCKLKIGKELYTRFGPVVIERLQKAGFRIFLDLKFHDIPNTVAGACSAAAGLGVWMINVHALGGRKMLLAAREAIDKAGHKPLLVAVTVLTSLSDDDLKEIGIGLDVDDAVCALAMLSKESGLDGVVCSAQEAALLRDKIQSGFLLVTPGIRPAGSGGDDQHRIVTPKEAILAGSDYLVIGRPITRAADPLKTLEAIELEVKEAFSMVAGR